MIDFKQHAINQALDQQARDKFDRMADLLAPAEQGVAKIDHFTIDTMDAFASIGQYGEEYVPTGRYARLMVKGQLMMSDTPMERRTNLEAVEKARGRVLIAGLGLGMILRAILRRPEVSHITVLEKHQDVIDLVRPSLASLDYARGGKLTLLTADVFEWEPHPDTPRYHTIYFDIWPNSTVANLPEMHLLHKRYRPLLAKGGWMDSWNYRTLLLRQRQYAQFTKKLPAVMERHWKEAESREAFADGMRRLLAAAKEDDRLLDPQDIQIIRQFAAAKGIELERKQMNSNEIVPGMQIRVRNADLLDKGFVLTVIGVRGNRITTEKAHSGLLGGDPTSFIFYAKDGGFEDGTGTKLSVEAV